MVFLSAGVLLILLQVLVFGANGDKNETDASTTRKNGKTYFLQLRNAGEGDPKYRTYWRKNLGSKYASNGEEYEVIGSLVQRKEGTEEPPRKNEDYLDEEWSAEFKRSHTDVPDIVNDLYKSMNANEFEKIQNASVIRCIFEANKINDNDVFQFDIDSLRNSNLSIVDAELYIYRYQNEIYKNYETSNYVARLYQILSENATNENFNTSKPDVHKLLNVVYVSSIYDGWQIFKVKTALENWLQGDDNLGFMVTVRDAAENAININFAHANVSDEQYQPFVVIYMKNQKEKYPFGKKDEPKISNRRNLKVLQNGEIPCSRHIWYVNFQDLGWDSFVLEPKGFMAYQCKGSCRSSLTADYSNHGKILKFFQNVENPLESPSCVATDYKALVMMFIDKNNNVVIKKYQDMIVERCGCR